MKTYFIQAIVKRNDFISPVLIGDLIQANSYAQAITIFYEVVQVPSIPTNQCWAQITTANEITYVEQ